MSKKKAKEVHVEITEKDYRAEADVEEEFRVRPGRHKLTRGGFLQRHPNFKPEDTNLSNCKVRITMFIDADVLEHFKHRATQPNAAPYQTQINNELRSIMEHSGSGAPYSSLVNDDRFITAVAQRVQERRVKRG